MKRLQVSTAGTAPTQPFDAPICGRCPRCHPGKAWGGDERCRVLPDTRPWVTCPCHTGGS